MAIERFNVGPRMSQAVTHNGTAYLAGQVADSQDAGLQDQARQTLANVDKTLALVGSNKSRVLSVTVYLSSIGDFASFNEIYDAWIDKANPPVRACVEARLAAPGFRCEVCAIAAVD